MIAFLTLLYCGVLYLLVKFGVIRLTLFWKLSPALWFVLLLILLFIPMQWGAPSGAVTLYRTVIEIVPDVAGTVTKVPAEALEELDEGDVLFQIDPRPYQYAVSRLEADTERASADAALASIELERFLQAAKTNAVSMSDVDEWRAREASSAATVKSLKSQLDKARWDLERTTVRAPTPGYIVALTLRPGQRVTMLTSRSWLAFVDESKTYLVAGIQQFALRHVQPGQPADVVFNVYPGRTYAAKVLAVVPIEGEGQMAPSGDIPAAPSTASATQPYGVRLVLDGGDDALRELPTGAIGSVAIYTDSGAFTHVIRKVMMRMQTFINYVVP